MHEFQQFWYYFLTCKNLLESNQIRGATAPNNQDRLKRLLPDSSTGGIVVGKALSSILIGRRYASIDYVPFLTFEENTIENFETIYILQIDI